MKIVLYNNIKQKQFLECTDTIVAWRTGAIFSRFSGEVGEERVHGSRRASFCSPEKTRRILRILPIPLNTVNAITTITIVIVYK